VNTRLIATLAMVIPAASVFAADEKPKGAPAEVPAQATPPVDWKTAEAGSLTDYVQLTTPDKYIRAGESYFSPNDQWIVFQAVPVPPPGTGKEPDANYSMFVAKLRHDADDKITGIDEPIRISPEGSANTCGFFNPRKPGTVIFGSTLVTPAGTDSPGYQRGTRSYRWSFPAEMEMVSVTVPQIIRDTIRMPGARELTFDPKMLKPTVLYKHPGYDAECSFDPSGRFIVFSSQEDIDEKTGRPNLSLYVYDTETTNVSPLVRNKGYNGGPFFSPDGNFICYRSDRNGDDLLQVYVAELQKDASGAILGIKEERRVTDNPHVNWGPFWHTSGKFLIYATSEVGHDNYEVFSVEAPVGDNAAKKPGELKHRRITHAPGFDGLPVVSGGSQWMMWTSQRGPKREGEAKPSSQIWAARVVNLEP